MSPSAAKRGSGRRAHYTEAAESVGLASHALCDALGELMEAGAGPELLHAARAAEKAVLTLAQRICEAREYRPL